jgi:serine/threonine protein kinase
MSGAPARAAKKNKKKRAAKLKESGGGGGAADSELVQGSLQQQQQQEAAEERQRRACTIKLDNVDYSLKEEDVRQVAGTFGTISHLSFNRGHAFVEYATPEQATQGFENLDGAVVGKRSFQTCRFNPTIHGTQGARGRGGRGSGRARGGGRGRGGGGRGAGRRGLAGTRSEETVNSARGSGVSASRSSEGLNVLAAGGRDADQPSSAPGQGDARLAGFQQLYRQQLGLAQQPAQPTGGGGELTLAARVERSRPGGIDMSNVVMDDSAAFEHNGTWSSRAEHKYTPKQDDFPSLGQHKAAPEEFPSLGSAMQSSAGARRNHKGVNPMVQNRQQLQPAQPAPMPEPEPEPEPEPPVLNLEQWTEWDVDQVCAWLGGLNGLVGKEACIKAFADNSINGPVLEMLDDPMLKDDLGITALGDRLAVRRGIKELQAPQHGGEASRTGGSPASARGSPHTDSPRGRNKSESKMIALMRDQPEGRENFEQVVVDAGATDPLIVYTQLHLGDGATGQVFEGSYQGMVCAVKRMSATERSSLRELDAYRSGRLRHPSLVHYQTCKMEHGLLYLAMDLCHTSLSMASPKARAVLARAQRDPALQRKLAKQLMEGLTYLHSEISMVHRDLKPSNVLVDVPEGGGEPRLLICDMGLSKRRDAAVSMSTLGDDVGTLGWKPPILNPEVHDGDAQPDTPALAAGAASDVFSAGLVLFHLLSGGGHPFDSPDHVVGSAAGGSGSSSGSGPTTERRLQSERQARIAAWGSEWQDADVEERARRQSDFMEQLQAPRAMLPLKSSAGGQPDADAGEASPSLRALLGAGGAGGEGRIAEQHAAVLTPEAASLIAMMLHPDQNMRIKAPQTLTDPYFKLFELQEEDEIPEDKLPQPWRKLQGGEGAFGVVYRSTYQGCDVAVKRIIASGVQPRGLRFSLSGDSAMASVEEDFCREVQLLRKLRHPHIVLFMGWCRAGKDLCIVTELCTTSVEAIVHGDQRARYSTTMALSIARDAAQGMAFLHEASPPVVHRDLKPANLLVDRVGKVKVCDFGLARRDGAMTDGAGTPNYLAPEILLDQGAADTASDVYSYGVVLHELFTRERPFVARLNLRPELAHLKMADHYQSGGSLLPVVGFPLAAGDALPQQVGACLALERDMRPRFKQLASNLDKIFRQFKLDQRAARAARPAAQVTQPAPAAAAAPPPAAPAAAPPPAAAPAAIKEGDKAAPQRAFWEEQTR